MKKALPLLLLLTVVSAISQAQLNRYVVRFKNKGGSPYSFSNPLAYLSQKAIDRRTRYSIVIDSTDLPVTPSYVTQVRNVTNVTLLNVSRWLNAITILTTDANAINTINAFPFVQSVTGVAARPAEGGRGAGDKFANEITGDGPPVGTGQRIEADYFNYGTGSYDDPLA